MQSQVSPAPVSISMRIVTPILLFLVGAYAMVRWDASCGFALGDNADTVKSGRACGAARTGIAYVLPLVAVVPALVRSPSGFYLAAGGVLVLDLIVVFGLAPSA
jgi:hypothetical protein